MKRLSAATLSLILLFTPFSAAYAGAKAGASCARLNATSKVSGVAYVCVKNGKKLTWKKANVIKPVNPAADQMKNDPYRATKLKAFSNIRAASEIDGSVNVELVYHIGESFPVDLKNLYIKQILSASKLYGTFFTKKEKIHIYLYTEKDADAIQSDLNLNFNMASYASWFEQWNAGRGREHNIGIAGYYLLRNNPPQGHAGLGLFSGSSLTSIRPYGIQVVQHEYWHVVQDYFMQSGRNVKFSDSDSYDLFFPPTFREGSTNTISFALSLNTPDEYFKLYETFVSDMKTNSGMKIFKSLTSKEMVISALKDVEVLSKNSEAHEASYLLGQLLYEWVISEYGFDGYRKLITNQLIGNSFEDNLKASLGITKDDLYNGAASHILAAFVNK